MANNTNERTVKVRFDGSSDGLSRAARQAQREMRQLQRDVRTLEGQFSKSFRRGAILSGLTALGTGANNIMVGLATAVQQLSGAVLLLPAGLVAAGAAFGTLKMATMGFGDALASLGDPEAFAEAIGKLAPNAQAAALAFRDLYPQMQALQQSVQDSFFENLDTSIRSLGQTYLPILNNQLTSTGSNFNNMARYAAGALMKPSVVDSVTRSLSGTNGMLVGMRTSLGDALEGFLGLAGVGSSYLPALGDSISSVSERFRDWVNAGIESGRINEIIDQAIVAFKDLGAILRNVWEVGSLVFGGLGNDGETFLGTLRETTAQVRAFLESFEGQQALSELGAIFQTVTAVMRDLFMTALREGSELLRAWGPALATVATTIGVVLKGAIELLSPPLQALGRFFSENPALVSALTVAFLGLVGAFKAAVVIMNVVRSVQTFIGVVKTVTTIVKGWTIAQTALNLVMAMNPFTLIVIAIMALVAAIVLAWQNSETFRNIVLGAWEAVKSGISAAVEWIKGAISWFGQLPGLVGGWFTSAKDWAINAWNSLVAWVKSIPSKIMAAIAGLSALASHVGNYIQVAKQWAINKFLELVAWVRGLPGRILSSLGNLGSLLLNAGSSLVNGFLSGIRNAWGRITSFVSDGIQRVRNLFPFSPAKEGPLSGSGYVTHSGKALASDFAKSIQGGVPLVEKAATGLMDSASMSLKPKTSLASTLSAAFGEQNITVKIGERDITDMIATEINGQNRQTRRTVGAGRFMQ